MLAVAKKSASRFGRTRNGAPALRVNPSREHPFGLILASQNRQWPVGNVPALDHVRTYPEMVHNFDCGNSKEVFTMLFWETTSVVRRSERQELVIAATAFAFSQTWRATFRGPVLSPATHVLWLVPI